MASKTALITDSRDSSWASCVHIVNHLTRSHAKRLSPNEQIHFYYTSSHLQRALTGDFEPVMALAREIHEAQPKKIIFIDHRPHPIALLIALNACYGNQPRPRLYFHLHGDFLLNAPLWKFCENLLTSFEVFFFCASNGQRKLFSSFIRHPSEFLDICPYPVDTSTFHADSDLRKKWRAHLKMNEQDFILVYSGRLSLQKNVDVLVERIADFQEKSSLPLHLFLAGEFDDLGSPLFESHEPLGASFQRFQETLGKLAPKLRRRMTHLGHLSATDLAGLYNAADALVSFSLHHDEDFGMAPAEALCCGCPSLLTSWGGFSGFASAHPLDCQLIPVRFLSPKGHMIDEAFFQKSLLRLALSENSSFELRKERAQRYQSRFSIDAIAATMTESMKQIPVSFRGWTPLFDEMSERMKKEIPLPEGPRPDSIYGKLYSAYID